MKKLLHNIRFYILLASILLSGVLFLWVKVTIIGIQLEIIRLEQLYAFASLILLYITLLIGPFCFTFHTIPYRSIYIKARRALGVAVFYFALLHTCLAFFGQLGGFRGLGFLSGTFLLAITTSFIALIILFLLTITSFDSVIRYMGLRNWKLLHRFIYLAGILILIHTVMLGSHFSDLSSTIPQLSYLLLACLLLLEAPRLDRYLHLFFPHRFGISFVLTAVLLTFCYGFFIHTSSTGSALSFDIHAAHRQLAQQALQPQQLSFNAAIDVNKLPGLNGDKNKRYTVSFNSPPNAQPNQDTTLQFRVYDASSGNPVSYYRIIYAKTIHMIVVNSSLTYFAHIHPTQEGQDFVITTQFPASGLYHIYLELQPFGGIEQQVGFTFPVGITQSDIPEKATQPEDTNETKTFGGYDVTLNTNGGLTARDMTLGNDKITFTIKDAKTKQPITTLKPYLASFGHLTMIQEESYDFLHVHPYSLTIPTADASSGPSVDFLPIGIYGPFKPGLYRAFAEFNPDGKLFTADFTIKVN